MEVDALMKLMELKKSIQLGQAPSDFMVFVCQENFFLADQYIEAICAIRGHVVNSIKSLSELTSALSLVFCYNESTNVLKTDVFDEAAEDYSVYENAIVVCSKIDKKLKSALSDYVIDVPALKEWQIKDYMSVVCPGLDDAGIDWLYEAREHDIYGIDSELAKISLFPIPAQNEMLARLRFEPGSYLYAVSNFELADAIVANNRAALLDFALHEDYLNVEPLGIVALALAKAKNILFITQNSGKTPADLGISDKQFNYLKRSYACFSLNRLQRLVSFLSAIDLRLKNGLLDMPKKLLLDYIISNTLA